MSEESREIRKNRAIQRLRRGFLAATVLAVATVAGLYLAGRSEPPEPAEDELEGRTIDATGDFVTVGEGFERTVSEGDREVFTVRGERYGLDREGIVYLEGVEVTIYREDGSFYQIEGAKGRFDLEEREGRLAGGVRVSAPDGLELTTRQLRVTNRGRQVRSDAPVEFRIGDAYRGHAKGLHAWLSARRFLLDGFVRVVSLPGAEHPLQLEAEGLILDRNRNLVRSEKWAVLRRRGERISALGLALFFAEDETTPRFVRAEGNVTGFLRSAAGGSLDGMEAAPGPDGGEAAPAGGIRRLSFRTERLTLLLTEDGRHPQKLEMERGVDGKATLRTLGPPEVPRYRLEAPSITGWFAGGAATRAEATGGVLVVMDEPFSGESEEEDEEDDGGDPAAGDGPATRRATARRAEAAFDAEGALETVVLEGDVVLTDPAVKATGERGVFAVGAETAELLGRPAVATTESGRMEAPRILYTRESGLVHGTDGVRARLDEAEGSPLAGSPLARGDGPIWIEAADGFLRDEPRTFLFTGSVRAWRGDDLLVSEELRGNETEDRLVATGGVRTLWTPDEGGGGGPGKAPLEVEAEELVYRRGDRLLVYTGDVAATQEGRTVACRELVAKLAEGGGFDELVATGDVRVDDPAQGRSLRGERAVYDPQARTVDVTAAPGGKVTLKDRTGHVIEGPRMIYDIDNDRVRVIGRGEEAAAAGPGES